MEQRAAAAAKSKATRTARGIIGKRKRAAVKGTVTGAVVTPVTGAPPEPAAPPAQPASNTPTGGNVAK